MAAVWMVGGYGCGVGVAAVWVVRWDVAVVGCGWGVWLQCGWWGVAVVWVVDGGCGCSA